jgi:hypothetical protein
MRKNELKRSTNPLRCMLVASELQLKKVREGWSSMDFLGAAWHIGKKEGASNF